MLNQNFLDKIEHEETQEEQQEEHQEQTSDEIGDWSCPHRIIDMNG